MTRPIAVAMAWVAATSRARSWASSSRRWPATRRRANGSGSLRRDASANRRLGGRCSIRNAMTSSGPVPSRRCTSSSIRTAGVRARPDRLHETRQQRRFERLYRATRSSRRMPGSSGSTRSRLVAMHERSSTGSLSRASRATYATLGCSISPLTQERRLAIARRRDDRDDRRPIGGREAIREPDTRHHRGRRRGQGELRAEMRGERTSRPPAGQPPRWRSRRHPGIRSGLPSRGHSSAGGSGQAPRHGTY